MSTSSLRFKDLHKVVDRSMLAVAISPKEVLQQHIDFIPGSQAQQQP